MDGKADCKELFPVGVRSSKGPGRRLSDFKGWEYMGKEVSYTGWPNLESHLLNLLSKMDSG
jgi:hypothetical protein